MHWTEKLNLKTQQIQRVTTFTCLLEKYVLYKKMFFTRRKTE